MSDAPLEKCGDLRQEPGREGALSGFGAFQGLGFLLDGLRARRAKTETPKEGGSGDSGAAEKKSDSGEKKAAAAELAAADRHRAAGPERRSGRWGLRCGAYPVNIEIAAVFSSPPISTDWPP